MAKFSILDARITSPGRFEGERIALALAYRNSLNSCCEDFGSVDELGYFCSSYVDLPNGTYIDVFFQVDNSGFITEISSQEYEAAEDEEAAEYEYEEYEDALEDEEYEDALNEEKDA